MTIDHFSTVQVSIYNSSMFELLILKSEKNENARSIVLDFDSDTMSIKFDMLHLQKRITDEGVIISYPDLIGKDFSLRNVNTFSENRKDRKNNAVIVLPDKISDVSIFYGNDFMQTISIDSKSFKATSPDRLHKYFNCELSYKNMEVIMMPESLENSPALSPFLSP